MKKQETGILEGFILVFAIAIGFTVGVIIIALVIWSLAIPCGMKVLLIIVDFIVAIAILYPVADYLYDDIL